MKKYSLSGWTFTRAPLLQGHSHRMIVTYLLKRRKLNMFSSNLYQSLTYCMFRPCLLQWVNMNPTSVPLFAFYWLFFSVRLSEFVKSKAMYFPQLSQSHSLFSSLNCYCSTHDPFSLSQPPPHTPTHVYAHTHTPHKKNKSLKYTHHRGWEHIYCETKNPELQSYAGTPTRAQAGMCDIQTQQETKTLSFFRHFLFKCFEQ